MDSVSSNSNKQFIAVVLFLLFIIISITCLIFCDSKTKNNNSNLNKGSNEISNSGVPDIEQSEPVTVIVSNNNNTSNVTVNSNSTSSIIVSNKVSNKGSNNPNTNKNYVPISYFITELSANKIYVGGTAKVGVSIYPSNATNKTVSYSSTNSNVARVSSDGTITGVSAGVCYINIDVNEGGSTQVQIQVFNRNASNVTPVVVSNSNTTSKSNSQSNSTSKSNSNSNPTSKSNSNTTVPVTGVSVSPTTVTITKGYTTTLKATVSPSNATNKSITWSSGNTNVATVTQSGVVTGKSAGTVRITATASNGASSSCTVTVKNPEVKNGWYTENGERVYYENGVKKPKIGNVFDITLYGTTAWTTMYSSSAMYLNLKSASSSSSSVLEVLQPGTKVTIIGDESNGYIQVKVPSGKTGWVVANSLFVNLPDVMPNLVYDIYNAYSSAFITGECESQTSCNSYTSHNIPGVTGQKLYKFSKAYNAKLGRNEFYAPLQYYTAKKLQAALKKAKSINSGYNFIIYDTYRPKGVSKTVSTNLGNLITSNTRVSNAINHYVNGYKYSQSWFINNGGGTDPTKGSMHSAGLALDMGLLLNGKKMATQTNYGVLDVQAVTEYNTTGCNGGRCEGSIQLANIMTSSGFSALRSEWWHFDLRNDSSINGKLKESFDIYN